MAEAVEVVVVLIVAVVVVIRVRFTSGVDGLAVDGLAVGAAVEEVVGAATGGAEVSVGSGGALPTAAGDCTVRGVTALVSATESGAGACLLSTTASWNMHIFTT